MLKGKDYCALHIGFLFIARRIDCETSHINAVLMTRVQTTHSNLAQRLSEFTTGDCKSPLLTK